MRKIGYFLVLLSVALFSCNQGKKKAVSFYENGNAQVKAGNIIKAIVYYSEAIALDSSRVDYYMARGNSKLAAVDYEGAMADYSKVIQLDPTMAEAYLSRGVVSVYMKKFTDDAANDLAKAIQLQPNLTNAWYNLGVVKYVQHDLEAACKNWKKAAEMGSTKAEGKLKMYCK